MERARGWVRVHGGGLPTRKRSGIGQGNSSESPAARSSGWRSSCHVSDSNESPACDVSEAMQPIHDHEFASQPDPIAGRDLL